MFNVIVKKDHLNNCVLFDADSVKNGQITALINNEERVVGVDYYNMTTELEPKEVVKTIEQWRMAYNIPETDIAVRKRLRKGYALKSSPVQPRNRRLDDQKPAQIIHPEHVEQPLRRAEDKKPEIVAETTEKNAIVSVIEAIHANESDSQIADKMRSATLSETRKQRKAKRVEAAKRRYEAEKAATDKINTEALVQAEAPKEEIQAAPEATITLTESQLDARIAKAVAIALSAVSHVVAA